MLTKLADETLMDDMKSLWVDFVSDLSLLDADHMSGVQKIIHGVRWEVPGEVFFDNSIGLETFGYAERGNKMGALMRHYYDADKTLAALGIVRERIDGRKYGSAGFPLTGEVKTWTKQDFCMQSCTVTYWPDDLKVNIFYRTTEVIKKFGADLIFLKTVVLPQFNDVKSISKITFHFSNLTVHPMFYTTFLAHHPEPTKLLNEIWSSDPKFHNGIEKWMIKYLFEGDTSWVQKFSQARQTHLAMKRLMKPRKRLQLKRYFRVPK